MKDVETYQDLLHALNCLAPEQLRQPIQIADPPNNGKPVPLSRGIAMGSVGEFEFSGSRSTYDNKYHADDIVLLVDGNPFSEDGAMSHTMKKEGPDDKPVFRTIPNYGVDGPTKREEQQSPTVNDEFPAYIGKKCNRRARDLGLREPN